RRAKILDDGWKGGPFLDGLGSDIVGVLAGCSASTFRRFGLEGCLTPLEEERLGSVVEGSSAYFNPFAPQGHYNLDMTLPSDREVFRALLGLDKVNRAHVGMKGLLDPSQHGNSHHLRNFRLGGGRPVKFGLLSRRRARTKLNKRGAKKTKKKAAKQAKEPAKAKKMTNKAPAGKTKAGNAKTSSRGNKNARGAKGTAPQREKRLPLESVKPAGTPGGSVKRFPTMPTASRISFDFLHYIRPSPGATSTPKESFDQLVQFLSNWMSCGNANGGNSADDNDDDKVNGGSAIDVNSSNGGGGDADTNDNGHDDGGAVKKKKGRLVVNFLRNLCHVFYFNCNQVVDLLRVFPGEDDEHEPAKEKGNEAGTGKEAGSSCREEVFIALVCRITDESNLDLCLGVLTDREVSRCEARLGPVALFTPTQPDGEYKLDLRAFGDRQIATLLLGLERSDPTIQLLGMRHDGKYLEEGSVSWAAGVPTRGRFRTRVVTRRAFKTGSQLAASQAARWKIARSLLGWCERPPTPTPGPSTKPLSAAETSARPAALGEKSVLAPAIPVGEDEDREDDNRPRKRAVVRIPRKRRGTTAKDRGLKGIATKRRRAKSFSHLPRPRLSGEEFVAYLCETTKTNRSKEETSPTDRLDSSGSVHGCAAPEARTVGILPVEGDQALPGMATEGEELPGVVSDGLCRDGASPRGEVIPRRHVRRWPSSADIGMLTDGR
ncbi:unnamed protein product, partial [Ectocarpus sp. 8 AP-2014]